MGNIVYKSMILKYQEERRADGLKIDTAIIMIPEDEKLLDSAIHAILDGEENGFRDRMWNTESRISKEIFCDRLLNNYYYFLQPHKIRQLVYIKITELSRD